MYYRTTGGDASRKLQCVATHAAVLPYPVATPATAWLLLGLKPPLSCSSVDQACHQAPSVTGLPLARTPQPTRETQRGSRSAVTPGETAPACNRSSVVLRHQRLQAQVNWDKDKTGNRLHGKQAPDTDCS